MSRTWRHVFVAVALLVTSVMAVTSGDYGISQDESTHRVHGQILLDYFRGVSDRALREPLNADGSFPGTDGAYTAFDDPGLAWAQHLRRYVRSALRGRRPLRSHGSWTVRGAPSPRGPPWRADDGDDRAPRARAHGKLGDRHAGAPLRGAHAAPGRPCDDQSEGCALRGIVHLRSRAASRARSHAATGAALASRRSGRDDGARHGCTDRRLAAARLHRARPGRMGSPRSLARHRLHVRRRARRHMGRGDHGARLSARVAPLAVRAAGAAGDAAARPAARQPLRVLPPVRALCRAVDHGG